MSVAREEIEKRLVDHVLKHGGSLEFTRHFCKGCEPLPSDIQNYAKLASMVAERARGILPERRQMGVGMGTSLSWAALRAMPKLGHHLKAYVSLGPPGPGRVWLTTECTHGQALPIGQFVQVPTVIGSWDEVGAVLEQIRPTENVSTTFSGAYLFGFLVGIMIGDAHKPRQGRGHRHIDVTLSRRYDTNVAIGEFGSFCARQLGLRMERCPDLPKPADKPHGFYVWRSQSSPLIDWIFNIVLGLEDGQHTTYDEVKMEWALDAPMDFRLGLLHGIAESDGSVSVASQTVEFWVIPDWNFMIKLLGTFGLKVFRNREAVSLVKSQATKSFDVPVFASHLRTARYLLLELMATTRKLEKKERLPADVRQMIIDLASEGNSIPKIVVEVAKTKKLLVSFEAAQRWAKKSGKYTPRSNRE